MEDNSSKTSKLFQNSNPKLVFVLGVVVGVGVFSLISLIILLGMAVSSDDEDSAVNTNSNTNTNQVADTNTAPTASAIDTSKIVISDSEEVYGNEDADITFVEFSDFQCPYCVRFHEVMHQIVDEYPNDVAWIFKQFPIQSHPLGMPGAMATECAGDQGKFWEMSDMIFSNQQALAAESFAIFAGDLGLDVDTFNQCMSDNPHAEKIANDYQTGISSGVRGTPSSFVNGNIVPGAFPYESMKQMIDELLK